MSASTTIASVLEIDALPVERRDHRVAAALWPGEAGRLATNPIVVGAFIFVVLIAVQWGVTGIRGFEGLIFGLFVFLAANLSTLRTRREHMEELCESLPAGAHARTAGHLLALIGPALAIALVAGGVWLWDAARIAAAGEPLSILDVAQGPLLVILFAVAGVALARWVPFAPASLPGVVALATLTGGLASSCGTASRCSTVWFGLWVNRAIDRDGTFVGIRGGSPGWHLVYLVGLILIASTFAVMRDRRGRPQLVAGVVGLATMAVSALLQLP